MKLEKFPSTEEVTICLNCGDKGFTNAYVYCVQCLQVAVHRYCLGKVTFDEYVRWVCDNCEVKELNKLNIKQPDAISLENKNCTSFRRCKASFKGKVDVLESKSKRHAHLAGDSPGVKKSKKNSNPTSLRYDERLACSSSEQSHEAHTSILCYEQPQLANISPLLAKPSKEEGTCSHAELARQKHQVTCEEDIQPGTCGDSSAAIGKTKSISSPKNHHEEESTLGEDRRLKPQIRPFVNGDSSQLLKGQLPNEPGHDGLERAKPVIDFIWRGNFNIWNKEYEPFNERVVAHLSVKACRKVFEEANLFPPLLQLEMLPKAGIWPKSFITSEPTDDNIALYFFPFDTRSRKEFDRLVERMISEELAMRATVTNAELLVFASTELPLSYWRFQGKFYLWGVFRGKQDSSRRNTMPNGSSVSAVVHPTPVNELAVGGGGDVVNAKACDAESPLTPLTNSAGIGTS